MATSSRAAQGLDPDDGPPPVEGPQTVKAQRAPRQEARLGFATTREMLAELELRLRITTPVDWAMRQIASLRAELSDDVLEYRTVDDRG